MQKKALPSLAKLVSWFNRKSGLSGVQMFMKSMVIHLGHDIEYYNDAVGLCTLKSEKQKK